MKAAIAMHCRLYLDADMQVGLHVVIGAEQARYLKQVMRLQAGDKITVFNGKGGEYQAELTHVGKDIAECMLHTFVDVNRELPCKVHIIQAANRSEKIETVLQKATEMGAASFQILNSERATFKIPGNKLNQRLERWQKIIIEAAEQSERTALPQVSWLDKLAKIDCKGASYILHPRDAKLWLEVRSTMMGGSDVTFAVGPEGGWTDHELEALQQKGFSALTFGPRIMRTETAAPALLAAVQAVL